MKRHLSLKSEHLAELTTSELGAVAGGYGRDTLVCLTGVYPTINRPCKTEDCVVIATIESINAPCPTI